MGTLTLRNLATAKGAVRLREALGGSDEDYARMLVLSNKYLKDNPDLAPLTIGTSRKGSFYDHKKNRVGLSSSNPDVFSHELGHAVDLGASSNFYTNIITPYSKRLSWALNQAALPAAVAVAASNLQETTKQRLFNYAKGLAAISAAPNVINELRATHIASKNAPSYAGSLARLSPGLVAHGMDSLSPLAKITAVDYVRRRPHLSNIVAQTLGVRIPAVPPPVSK